MNSIIINSSVCTLIELDFEFSDVDLRMPLAVKSTLYFAKINIIIIIITL